MEDYINNDNIVFEKVWDDYNGFNNVGDFFEIKVMAYNKYVKVNNFNFYMSNELAKQLSNLIIKYIKNNKETLYEFEISVWNDEKMSIQIEPMDYRGHVIVKLKIQNTLYNANKNSVELFVETELGLLEQFGKNISLLVKGDIGYKISLNKEID